MFFQLLQHSPFGHVLWFAGLRSVFSLSPPPLVDVSLVSCVLALLLLARVCFGLCFEVKPMVKLW